MNLNISNVINVSVSEAGAGVGEYNTSNIALFSRETAGPNFGLLGYKIYVDPNDVATDFGSASVTYQMALGIFSQQPNILNNNGYLVVIPFISSETLAAAITRTASLVQYFGILAAEATTESHGLAAAAVVASMNKILFLQSQSTSDIAPGGYFDLIRQASQNNSRGLYYGSAAVIAVQTIAFGSLPTAGAWTLNYGANATSSLAFNANAAAIQSALELLSGLGSVTVTGSYTAGFVVTFIGVDGPATLLTVSPNTLTDTNSNPVAVTVYNTQQGLSAVAATLMCLVFAASYAGRGLSVNFLGSNTTLTMHLKSLVSVIADPSMTQTILNSCQISGADCYPSIQGVAKVFTSGANKFFDQVQNLRWFVGAIQVAGFNFLAQSSGKVPQTEPGMSAFKGAYRVVCNQAVTNQYLAPNPWTSASTFGNLVDFLANVLQSGFYIYSIPVAQQLPADRAARNAPLVQIAIKEAGAIQKGNVLINVNA